MDSQEKTFKNPIEEQRKAALEHYEQVSRAANHWSSFVESAIKAYNPESCPPPVSAEIVSHEIGFGDYVSIEMKRFGCPNEFYTYKVIGRLKSNSWIDVPAMTHKGPTHHDTMEEILNCVCEGVGEDRFERYRVCDVKLANPRSHPSPSAPVVAGQVKAKHIDKLLNESNGSFKDLAEDSYDVGYNEGIHSPAERIEGDAVDCVYEIDFGGNLKCRMKIVGNKINVEAAMNGWGDGISIDEIKITELKTPHHE